MRENVQTQIEQRKRLVGLLFGDVCMRDALPIGDIHRTRTDNAQDAFFEDDGRILINPDSQHTWIFRHRTDKALNPRTLREMLIDNQVRTSPSPLAMK